MSYSFIDRLNTGRYQSVPHGQSHIFRIVIRTAGTAFERPFLKYSQLELAGNLYYPVAIIVSTALLLASLGLFLKMAPKDQAGP